jgi:hypothetical protein
MKARILFSTLVLVFGQGLYAQNSRSVAISEIAGQEVRAKDKVTIDRSDDAGGELVRVDGWALPDDLTLCVIVNLQTSLRGHAYCNSEEPELGNYRVHGVHFGVEELKGRAFVARAALFKFPPPAGSFEVKEWLDKAVIQSLAKYVEVLEQHPNSSCLTMTSIDGAAIDSRQPMIVNAAANISGGSKCQDAGQARIYLVSCPWGADQCRVLGPTESLGNSWLLRNAMLGNPGIIDQTTFVTFAILVPEPLQLKAIPLNEVGRYAAAQSTSVTVVTKSFPTAVPFVNAIVKLSEIVSGGRPMPLSESTHTLAFEPESIDELSGTAEGMPLGGRVYVGFMATDLRIFVHGPALMNGSSWVVPIRSPGASAKGPVRVFAFVTLNEVAPMISYGELHGMLHGQSLWVSLAPAKRRSPSRDGGGISLESVTIQPRPDHQGVELAAEGSATNLDRDALVCLGIRDGSRSIQTVCTASVRGEQWQSLPKVVAYRNGEPAGSNHSFTIMAFVSDVRPPEWIAVEDLGKYTRAESEILTLPWRGETTMSWKRRLAMPMPLTAVAILLGLILLFFIWRRLPQRVRMSAEPSPRFSKIMTATFDSWSILGIALLAVALVAMYGYYPLYVEVLMAVFPISLVAARALALTLMTFTALAGVMLDLIFGRLPRGFGQIFVGTTLLLMALTLWTFQALVYYQYYADGSSKSIAAWAMGMAGFFISAIETVVFFFAIKLGWNLMAFLICRPFVGRERHSYQSDSKQSDDASTSLEDRTKPAAPSAPGDHATSEHPTTSKENQHAAANGRF